MKNEPAFPRPASRGNNYLTGEEDVVVDPQKGMTLRDYFAAKALTVYWSGPDALEASNDIDAIAGWCYCMADAMLKARDD